MIWTLGRSWELPLQASCLGAWMSQPPGSLLQVCGRCQDGHWSRAWSPQTSREGDGMGGGAGKKAVAVTGAPKHATHTVFLTEAAALWAAVPPHP